MGAIATVDLARWYAGGAVAVEVDTGLQRAGLIFHPWCMATAWIRPGAEANAYAEGTATPPDLKESFSLGAETAIGDPEVDRVWFAPNVWPDELPSLQELATAYAAQMRRLADDVLALFARALGLPANPFEVMASTPTWKMNINHYPPAGVVGEPEPGQFRSGPHTDFSTVTILDREPGAGGLQGFRAVTGDFLGVHQATARRHHGRLRRSLTLAFTKMSDSAQYSLRWHPQPGAPAVPSHEWRRRREW